MALNGSDHGVSVAPECGLDPRCDRADRRVGARFDRLSGQPEPTSAPENATSGSSSRDHPVFRGGGASLWTRRITPRRSPRPAGGVSSVRVAPALPPVRTESGPPDVCVDGSAGTIVVDDDPGRLDETTTTGPCIRSRGGPGGSGRAGPG